MILPAAQEQEEQNAKQLSRISPEGFTTTLAPQSFLQPDSNPVSFIGSPAVNSQALFSNMASPSSFVPPSPMAMTPAMSSGIQPLLQNIVSTVNLGCQLDLKKIALHARNAEYNPKRFAAD